MISSGKAKTHLSSLRGFNYLLVACRLAVINAGKLQKASNFDKRSPRLPLQHVACGCKVCDRAPGVPASPAKDYSSGG